MAELMMWAVLLALIVSVVFSIWYGYMVKKHGRPVRCGACGDHFIIRPDEGELEINGRKAYIYLDIQCPYCKSYCRKYEDMLYSVYYWLKHRNEKIR